MVAALWALLTANAVLQHTAGQIPVTPPSAFLVCVCVVEEPVEEAVASAAVSSLLLEWADPECSAPHSGQPVELATH